MPENNGHWHLDKRISWGHIVATVVLLFTFLAWSTTLDKRVEVNGVRIDNNTENINRLETTILYQYEQIQQSLMRLEDKLDAHEVNSQGG